MITLWLLVHLPIVIPTSIFAIAYGASTSYYLDQGFFLKDEALAVLVEEAQRHEGLCFQRSLALSDIMTSFGYKGHTIKVGRMEEGYGDYHAWVEYHGGIYETTINGITAGMDRQMMTRIKCYKVYDEIKPGELDFIKFRSPKEREDAYYYWGCKKVVDFEDRNKLQ